jgi:hypothetical protein
MKGTTNKVEMFYSIISRYIPIAKGEIEMQPINIDLQDLRDPISRSEAVPDRCPICEDERQYIGLNGQEWTTLGC